VICGPGSIGDAHRPDEFITFDQIRMGEAFVGRIVEECARGPGG
jgi:acetylornithine deacetylase